MQNKETWDIVIIGAGIIGCELAYYLSRYKNKVLLLEKENDVAMGTTRANSAILHAGYDPKPGTRMARSNVRGNQLAYEQCKVLDVEYKNCGSLVLAFDEEDQKKLQELYSQGLANSVPGLELWDAEQVHQKEPFVSKEVRAALYAPTAGVVNPWDWAIALAEVALRNGVEIRLNTEVKEIESEKDGYKLQTDQGTVYAGVVLNAAGVHAAEIHAKLAEPNYTICPTKGEYYLLDRYCEKMAQHVLFQCPNSLGKGVLVAPTIHGNIIVGPNAEPGSGTEDTATTAEGLAFVRSKAQRTLPQLDWSLNIRNFAGVRANCNRGDFILEWVQPGFLDIAGIQSPGLTAAPALAEEVLEKLSEVGVLATCKENWKGERKVIRFNTLSDEEKNQVIRSNPLYGRVICRCETVTEGEIVEAIHRPLPATTLDGVKRRTSAGLGRCQGGFCGPKVLEILHRELNKPAESIEQDRKGSYLLLRREGEEQ